MSRNMICENCKKHIERKFLSKGKTVNCLNYACERPYINPGLIECTRDEICDYIYQIMRDNKGQDMKVMFGGREVPEMLPEIKYVDISDEEYQRIQNMFKCQPKLSRREDDKILDAEFGNSHIISTVLKSTY